MNGVALLVALSALSVDHAWRRTEDDQVEFVVQVEPVVLHALLDGREVASELPAGAGRVDRLCIRVGGGSLKTLPKLAPSWPELNKPAERQAAGAASEVPLTVYVAAADGQAYESRDLTHGWRPVSQDASAYLVQIDPRLLRSLQEGDELYAAIETEAGKLGSIVISCGNERLPREAARPPVRTVAQVQSQSARGSSPAADVPPTTDLTRGAGGSIYGPAVDQAEAQGGAPARAGFPSGWNINDASGTGGASAQSRDTDPQGAPLHPPATSLLDVPEFDRTQFPQRESSGGLPRTGAARTGSRPSTSGQFVGNRNVDDSAAGERLGPAEHQQQDEPPVRTASRSTANRTGADNSLARRSTSFNNDEGAGEKKPEFPTLPFTMSLFALFLSLGANLYLGWTAAEFYSRYKLAVERLRGASRN